MPILGIETSCDETAAAILSDDGAILAEAVLSQQEHAAFGGVVPEIAARAHLAHLPRLVAQVREQAAVPLTAIAATTGPGLIGGLIVGSGFARGLALATGLPFVAVNHLEAHALTARLPSLTNGLTNGLAGGPVEFPYLLLLVSGGHCQCVLVEAVGRYRRLGGTIDDAVGEAFDKVAKMLGLGWPGGPALERLALSGDPARHALPRPLFGRPGCDFSFSGLKTAVAQLIGPQAGALRVQAAADIAASFQAAVAAVLADRVSHALDMCQGARPSATPSATPSVAGCQGATPSVAGCQDATPSVAGMQVDTLVVAGGVAANGAVRTALASLAAARSVRLVAPPIRLCGDNAVMVAWAGIERLRLGLTSGLDTAPRPRWPLEALSIHPATPG